ncbi:glycosyltransferase [Arsenicicoccus cauae]|uniref:glycosyltransferase n=1 Tax=Arsenicicoccus cauae TaxID=2663847 RepID=UPI00370DB260
MIPKPADAPTTVVHVIHSLGAGGAENVLVELARTAPDAGLRIVVVGLSDAEDDRNAHRLAEAGATVYQLHAGRYDLGAVRRLAAIVRRERGDVVHTHLKHADLVGGLAARLVGVPAVSTLHVIESDPRGAAHRARVRAAVLARATLFDRVVALSEAQRAWYSSFHAPTPVVPVPNGVREPAPPSPTGARAALRAELGVDDRTLLGVTVSLMRPEKGHAVALAAVRLLPADLPFVLALAGDGPLLDTVRAEVEVDPQLHERVRVLGYRSDVDDLLRAADLVVHPSHEDALPTSLISALATGTPVVATRVGGIPDIVGDDAGILVPPDDPAALAAAVADLARDPGRREACGLAGRARYDSTFAAPVWVSRLRTLYDQLLTPPAEPLHDGPVSSVAVVSAVAPYPSDSGKAMVIAGFLRHLRSRLPHHQIHYLHVGPPLRRTAEFKGVQVHEMGQPSRTDQLIGLVRGVLLRRQSLQEAFLGSPRVAATVQQTLADLDPDLEIIDTVRMEQHVAGRRFRGRRVLYLDDLFSVRYTRMLEVLRDERIDADFDPLGQFSHNVPAQLHWLTRAPLTRRALLRFERGRVARSERRAARTNPTSVLLNAEEARHLREETGAAVVAIPPSIPGLSRSAHQPDRWDGRPEFAFVGLLSLAHNHDGLGWFLREGMDELLALQPDARLHVIGRDADESLLADAARHGDQVVVHGFVPDLDEALSRMCALVNPLRFGSGIKIKTLDALARGLPVVSTPVAAEGIATHSRPGLIVVPDVVEAARALAALVDPIVRERQTQGAQALYAQRFADPVVAAAYDEVFGTARED